MILLDSNEKDLPQKTRKRTRHPLKWKSAIKKQKFQTGEEYVIKSKFEADKIIPAKAFKPQVLCSCRFHCSSKIDVATQKSHFDQFYRLDNWAQKTLQLRTLVERNVLENDFNPIISCKKSACKYCLNDSSGIPQRVCLSFISKCLQISESTLKRILKYKNDNPPAAERRGKKSTTKYKERDLNYVRDFIKSFPTYESHYKALLTNKKYLNPNLNIRRIYKEYVLKCSVLKKKLKCVPEWKFRLIFNTEFNLSFRRLKIDTCKKCDRMKVLLDSEISMEKFARLKKLQATHWATNSRIRREYRECVAEAKNPQNKLVVLFFDLQRALEVPSISTGIAYYSRQLWCYNLCIFDKRTEQAFMHVWDESNASRGSQEISSCLYKYFSDHFPYDTEKNILYSDSCGGQNRNIKLTMMLKNFLANVWKHKPLEVIEQRFFLSGHSYNECDTSFATIAVQRKVTEKVHIPQHWYNLIRQAKKRDPKFVVYEMKRRDFLSVAPLLKIITNRKKSIDGRKISWLKMQSMIHYRSEPFLVHIQKNSAENTPTISVSFRKRNAPNKFPRISLKKLYKENFRSTNLNTMICRNL